MEEVFNKNTLDFLKNISYLIWLLPLLIAFARRNLLDKSQKKILSIVLVMIANDSLTYVLSIQKIPNLWVYHFYVPLLMILVMRIYTEHLHGVRYERYLKYLAWGFVLCCLIESTVFGGLKSLNSTSIAIASLLYVALSIMFFFHWLSKSENFKIGERPMFWLNMGMLVYYSSTLVLFTFYNRVISDQHLFHLGWTLNAVFYLFLIGSLSVALWLRSQV